MAIFFTCETTQKASIFHNLKVIFLLISYNSIYWPFIGYIIPRSANSIYQYGCHLVANRRLISLIALFWHFRHYQFIEMSRQKSIVFFTTFLEQQTKHTASFENPYEDHRSYIFQSGYHRNNHQFLKFIALC